MALECPHCHRLQPRLPASMWFLVAMWTMDSNTNPDCGRTTDPDMFLGSSLGPSVNMVPGDSTGYLDQHDPCSSMALIYQVNLRWQPRPLALAGLQWL